MSERGEVTRRKEEALKPKIFVFINSRYESGDVVGSALAEDGEFLAGHLSSNDSWFQHDMGLCSDWKHDKYKAHYPDGYELVHVADTKDHEGLKAAYALHVQKAEADKAETVTPR
jgi:hypothetical protein